MVKMWSVVGMLVVIAINTKAHPTNTLTDVPDPPKPVRPAHIPSVAPGNTNMSPVVVPKPHQESHQDKVIVKTTTLDPWDQFCEEACKLGLAGPECNCPPGYERKVCQLACKVGVAVPNCDCPAISHINLRDSPMIQAVMSEKIIISYVRPNNIKEEASTLPPPTEPHQQPTTAKTTTTTLDPLTEFCKEACEEGVGGPECDCADHPIG